VRVTKWKNNRGEGWEVDIRITLPDGRRFRERVKAPVSSKPSAVRWGQQREAVLLAQGGRRNEPERDPAPTLETFWPRFMEGHARANQEKPSSIETRERIWKNHLQPALGKLRLDEITDEQIARLKGLLSEKKPKTVNNVLTTINKLLKVAVDWRVVPGLPCRVRLLKSAKPVVEFYESAEFEKLVSAAAKVDPRTHIAVLLGGDAGLRLGEILGLEWTDVEFTRSLLKVQRAVYENSVTLPKGGKPRVVPMTSRLAEAIQAHSHLRGPRVLYRNDGRPGTKWWLKWMLDVAERRAGLRKGGRIHILRHTFCSRLASLNVPMLSIKELAGHVSLETTQRYMHLSAAAPREAIRALEVGGELGETTPQLERRFNKYNA
jgi:integrase